MDDGSLVALATFLLELKVFFKDRRKAVSLEHACLVDHLLLIGWQRIQVKEQRHVVACKEGNEEMAKYSTEIAPCALEAVNQKHSW